MWNAAILGYAVLLLVSVRGVARRYGTAINPFSLYAGISFVQIILAPELLRRFGLFDLRSYSMNDLTQVILLSAIYSGSMSLAFLVRWSPFFGLLRRLSPKSNLRVTNTTYMFLALQSSVIFAILMLASHVGTMWFSSPRIAYQEHREGAGVWWSLCHASLIVAYACALFRKRRTAKGVFALCFFFCFLAYFLGSKGMMLVYFVLAAFYLEFHVKPLSKRLVVAVCSILAVGALGLQIVLGTANSILDTLQYFDYFTNTAKFLSDFGTLFARAWGTVAISDLWSYVPRAIYPAKPLTYGASSIMATYAPNAAEDGSTPGMMAWSAWYWDFGATGVAVSGFFTGSMSRGSFDLFCRRPSIWALLLLGQMGFGLTFYGAPFPIFLFWLFAQYTCLKLVSLPVFQKTSALVMG